MVQFSDHMDKAQLSWKDYSIEVRCEVNLASDGKVSISIDPIKGNDGNSWILELFNADQSKLQYLTIKGTDSKGRLLSSDSLFLRGWTSRSDNQGYLWELRGGVAKLEVTPSSSTLHLEGANPCQVEYFTIGQEGFHPICRDVDLGTISISGQSKIENFDHVTGKIVISGECRANELTQWFSDVDRLVDRLLGGLSIAQGRRIYWSARQQYVGEHLDYLTLAGSRPTSSPREPLFSKLNLEPIVDTILENYSEDLIEKTGLDVAFDWYLAHPRLLEAEFLALMTALEHLVSIYIDQAASSAILPKKEFRKLRKALECIISSEINRMVADEVLPSSSSNELIETFRKGFGNLNRYPLRQNILSMLKDYKVPLQGIENQIPLIVKIRNDIVHRGTASEDTLSDENLFSYTAMLRELLKRIFLTLLRYEGEYQTGLGGWRWTPFPPK